MECRDVRPLLDLYREGQLSLTEAEQVAEHLDRCWGCRNELAKLAQWEQALGRLPYAEPRPGLWAATIQSLPVSEQACTLPAWKVTVLATGAASALLIFLWLIAEAVLAFENAGGADLASLIGTHPDLLLSHPLDAVLALLEVLPLANVLMGLLSALVAWLLSTRLIVTMGATWGWPRLISGVV